MIWSEERTIGKKWALNRSNFDIFSSLFAQIYEQNELLAMVSSVILQVIMALGEFEGVSPQEKKLTNPALKAEVGRAEGLVPLEKR